MQKNELLNKPHLDKGCRVYFMNGVARCATSLMVEIVALYEDTMITETPHPNISLTLLHQLYTLANVQPVDQFI